MVNSEDQTSVCLDLTWRMARRAPDSSRGPIKALDCNWNSAPLLKEYRVEGTPESAAKIDSEICRTWKEHVSDVRRMARGAMECNLSAKLTW
jgi:hypothetical protein